MNAADTAARRAVVRRIALLFILCLSAGIFFTVPGSVLGQETGPRPADAATEEASPQGAAKTPGEAARMAQATLDAEEEPETDEAVEAGIPEAPEINILELLVRGGWLMLPIAGMSILVVTFGVERLLGLRRHKVLPPELISGLGTLAGQKGGLEPRAAYKLCQQYPSTAANVIRAMLLKVGRPHTELEHAVTDADEREAAKLYTNIRWLSLAAGVTPLLGLLGTVWGMIQAFFATANLPTGANKAEYLAQGIYVALVTTFAGLAVAIPAAVLAHVLEGRIQRLLRELDETLLGLMPQLERFEGRLRVSREQLEPLPSDKETTPGAGRAPRDTTSGKPPQQPAATRK